MGAGMPWWVDVLTEFALSAAIALLGYMTATKSVGAGLELPTAAGWLAAALGGIIGAGNHVRALRKSPTPSTT